MKKKITERSFSKLSVGVSTALAILLFAAGIFAQKPMDYTKYVNPFIGTGGHGHTFPGATVPFGAVQLSPDTRIDNWDGSSGYHYSDNEIMGFSHTHLNGTGIPDYCDILLMPTVGEVDFNTSNQPFLTLTKSRRRDIIRSKLITG